MHILNDERSYTDLKPTVLTAWERPRSFMSLRWKVALPLVAVIVVAAMITTYVTANGIARGVRDAQLDQLVAAARAVGEKAVTFGTTQAREADRVAFTQNVPDLVVAADGPALQALAEPLAVADSLDYLLVGTKDGRELVGLHRTPKGTYEATQDTLLDKIGFVGVVLHGGQPNASGIVSTEQGYALFTVVPIKQNNKIVGESIVGTTLDHLAQTLRGNSLSQLIFYGPEGELLRSTIETDDPALALAQETRQQVMGNESIVPVKELQIAASPYQAVYVPLVVESIPLGVIALLQPNNMWYATEASRHTMSLAFSGLAAATVIAVFAVVGLILRRLDKVTRTAQALAWGDPYARTGMESNDEIGELGKAIDLYARRAQKRQDTLETSLRQQRRETARLSAVLESIPDGIIVQDLDGRVVLMNEAALRLLGSQRVFRSSPLNELTAVVTDSLGASLAPGVYSLGDPQRVPLDGKILHAQAAAVLSLTHVRIGTVIVLRDITDEVKREQARETLVAELVHEARTPLTNQPLKGRPEDALESFIHEVNRNAIVLQRLITEIRELSTMDAHSVEPRQKALPAETLIWNVAREWQSVAAASKIEMHVVVLRRGLLVLGEERRLRWAIGNLIDNAVKYTQMGGHITLMLKASDDEQQAYFSIKDTGVGISADDLPQVFTRFFRGKPLTRMGEPIHTAGTGQGLFIAKRVIEAHGGAISLNSTVGVGTEVIFTLPLTANVMMDLSPRAVQQAEEPVERADPEQQEQSLE